MKLTAAYNGSQRLYVSDDLTGTYVSNGEWLTKRESLLYKGRIPTIVELVSYAERHKWITNRLPLVSMETNWLDRDRLCQWRLVAAGLQLNPDDSYTALLCPIYEPVQNPNGSPGDRPRICLNGRILEPIVDRAHTVEGRMLVNFMPIGAAPVPRYIAGPDPDHAARTDSGSKWVAAPVLVDDSVVVMSMKEPDYILFEKQGSGGWVRPQEAIA